MLADYTNREGEGRPDRCSDGRLSLAMNEFSSSLAPQRPLSPNDRHCLSPVSDVDHGDEPGPLASTVFGLGQVVGAAGLDA
jgi:hypothetical protein